MNDPSINPAGAPGDPPSSSEVLSLLRMIRAHKTATLLCADRASPIRYVIDNTTGALVAPIPRELLELDDYLLMVPEESFDALHIHVAPVVIDQRSSESADRHMAYHGASDPSAWVTFEILSANARHPTMGRVVADGSELSIPNALRGVEPRVCKQLNADPAGVAAMCQRRAGVSVERPLVVGLDPFGLDVRAKFGILRIEFDPPISDPGSAAALISELLARES